MARRVTRREFIGTAVGAAAIAGSSGASASAAPARPNVLFILADDLGYGDLSCYGRPDYKTPVLDALATQGVKFMSAYAAAPVCTPTRCAYITGRYPQRLPVGLEEPLKRSSPPDAGLPPNHPTIASLLKANGYATSLVGKWHLGWKPEFGPNEHGFDYFFGFKSGAIDFYTHESADGSHDLFENTTPVHTDGYMTDLITARAVRFIEQHAAEPFFLDVSYNAAHWPFQVPDRPSKAARVAYQGPLETPAPTRADYAAMLERADAGVGQILQKLTALGLEQNTLVIFTNDNGGEWLSRNAPLFNRKATLWEGGIRVPLILRWPGHLPRGKTSEQVAITMDLSASILAATGTTLPEDYRPDGINILPSLSGKHLWSSASSFGESCGPSVGRRQSGPAAGKCWSTAVCISCSI